MITEIVGYSDENGHSPFWDALGKHFFDLPYVEAERLCGLQSRTFLAELMPQYPIYVPMLPQAAQDCIGRIHPDGQEAFDILECEGFETHGGRSAFVRDLVRFTSLVSAGWRPLRFTWEQVMFHPEWVARRVRATVDEATGAAVPDRRAIRAPSRAA